MIFYPPKHLPDYYPTMYLDGYTPLEILVPSHNTNDKRIKARKAEKELLNRIEDDMETTVKNALNEILKDLK